MAKKPKPPCECCGEEGLASINVYDTDGRLYLPAVENLKSEKELGIDSSHLRTLSLCHPCMRFIEDNFRAGIAYLKNEKGGLKFRTIGPRAKLKK